jgi:hypothetical protein
MVLLAVATIIMGQPQPQLRPVTAAVQATATIRIVSAVRLKLDSDTNPGAPQAHESVVKATDGSAQPAKLIEFQ